MSVTAPDAVQGIPLVDSNQFIVVNAAATTNIINPGDLVAWAGTGSGIAMTGNAAYGKSSAIGIALDRNPVYDRAGRSVVNSALVVARHGVFRVTAAFSGNPARGVLAAPVTTGSGVNAGSGQTGLGATWDTAAPRSVSAGTGGTPVWGIGIVANWYNTGPAGTGQMDVIVYDRNADYY